MAICPIRSRGPGQVVVDVVAASVNGADWKVRAGEYKQAKFPLILGRDFSGMVSARRRRRQRPQGRRRGVRRARGRPRRRLLPRSSPSAPAIIAQEAGRPVARRCGGAGADRPHGDLLGRGHAEAQARRDHPDPGRRGRRGGLRHPARQAHRRARHHHHQHRQSRLRARASAPTRSSTTDDQDFTKVGEGLRRGVRDRRRRRGDAARSPCSSPAAAPPSSRPARRRRSPSAAT